MQTFPHLRFVLVGDSGEKDPEIYALVKKAHPAQVAAIVIRRAPGTEGDAAARFEGMTVVDDYRGQTDLLAKLVEDAAPSFERGKTLKPVDASSRSGRPALSPASRKD